MNNNTHIQHVKSLSLMYRIAYCVLRIAVSQLISSGDMNEDGRRMTDGI
jgi:hypothetical protein